jgi:hypothetical protein
VKQSSTAKSLRHPSSWFSICMVLITLGAGGAGPGFRRVWKGEANCIVGNIDCIGTSKWRN